jgi:hypothetical protein
LYTVSFLNFFTNVKNIPCLLSLKYRRDGTKVVTRIKKVTGDINAFVRELRIVLNVPAPANQLQSYDDIKFRAGNMIEIHGHRATEIRKWLGGLGF